MEYSVINCVSDRELRKEIERMAFYKGLSVYDLREFIQKRRHGFCQAVVWYADEDYLSGVPGEVIQIFRMQCPLVLVSTGKNTEDEKGEIGALFQEAFRRYLKAMKDTPGWKERIMVYGRLKICRQSRKIYLDEENIELSGFAYDVFLLLIEHVGEAVSRELINQMLPSRSRSSQRNVDTHIKYIRRKMACAPVIRCVRSVGYYIPMEEFYRYCMSCPAGFSEN